MSPYDEQGYLTSENFRISAQLKNKVRTYLIVVFSARTYPICVNYVGSHILILQTLECIVINLAYICTDKDL